MRTRKAALQEELNDPRPMVSVLVSKWHRTPKGFKEDVSMERMWREETDDEAMLAFRAASATTMNRTEAALHARIKELQRCAEDMLSTFRDDGKECVVTAERREAWQACLFSANIPINKPGLD
jgi:hypothetical protein